MTNIRTPPANKNYRDNWDRIFKKKRCPHYYLPHWDESEYVCQKCGDRIEEQERDEEGRKP